MTKGKRSHDIKIHGEPMLKWRDSVCVLLGELFPRSELSVPPGDRIEKGEEISEYYEIEKFYDNGGTKVSVTWKRCNY